MRHTIIGFFNSASEAEHAAERLRSSGFSETDIDVTNCPAAANDDDSPYGLSDESRYPEPGKGSLAKGPLNEDVVGDRIQEKESDSSDSIGRFFRHLFDNKEEAELFASVGRKNCIVSVHAETSELAEHARDILDDCGAVDVDNQIREAGWGRTAGSYTDIATEDLSPDVEFNRRSNLGVDGEKEISPEQDPDMVEGEHEKQKRRSRIIERRVDEELRLKERLRSDAAERENTIRASLKKEENSDDLSVEPGQSNEEKA